MSSQLTTTRDSIFEQLKHIDENGNEYWNSREFARTIEYTDYRNFLKVVEKAIEACDKSGYNPDYHIVEFNDMIEVGSGKKVRKTIEELGGTMPENLPIEDSIKKVEKKINQQNKKLASGN